MHGLQHVATAALHASDIDLECHARHGLDFDNVGRVATIPQLVELNIGYFGVGEAMFGALTGAVRTMRALMDRSRSAGTRSAGNAARRPLVTNCIQYRVFGDAQLICSESNYAEIHDRLQPHPGRR